MQPADEGQSTATASENGGMARERVQDVRVSWRRLQAEQQSFQTRACLHQARARLSGVVF